MSSKAFRNTVLSRLPPESVNRLQLQRVEMGRRYNVESPGQEIRHLFFLEAGIGSMTNQFSDGSEVEVGMFGWEGVMGVSALMGTRRSLNHVYMQLPGWGYCTTRELAQKEFQRGERFQELILRYSQAQFIQSAQTAGCNARHHVGQRLARWLLLCQDRAESDVMDLTQEFLATMLGVERPAVSVEASKLQASGLIEYSRGKVHILDRKGLEKMACECYGVVSHHLNSYAVQDEKMG
jgi:CRP-like cAMP-binding protein